MIPVNKKAKDYLQRSLFSEYNAVCEVGALLEKNISAFSPAT